MTYTKYIWYLYILCNSGRRSRKVDGGILAAVLGHHEDAMLKDIQRTAAGGSGDQGFNVAGAVPFALVGPGTCARSSARGRVRGSGKRCVG